jgi:two-component system chemotaxis response regulator CheY
MIVDDDRTTVKLLKTLLELDGFEVVTVPRGADVLPQANDSMPDIVLMDYHLSDMQGVDIIRQMRTQPAFAGLPIVMTSGMNVESEAMQAGATSFLLKPFEPDELPLLFNRLLAG